MADWGSDHAQGPGWWKASDGRWYPPESHPDYRPQPPAPEPTVVPEPIIVDTTVPLAMGPTSRAEATTELRRVPPPPKRTLWTDLRDRRGFRIGAIVVAVVALLGVVGSLTGDDKDRPTKVQTQLPTTSPLGLAELPTTTTALPTTTTASTTTTPTATTTTAAMRTTAAPTTPAASSTTVATTTTVPATTGTTSARTGVTPGAFCSPQGITGFTNAGTPMVCTTTATDDRARWRAA